MTADKHLESHQVTFGKRKIEFSLKRSQRKTLSITVQPDVRVVITAPELASVENIKSRVKGRATWILKQQAFFETFLPKIPARRFISGETHRYLGRQYRLKVMADEETSVKLQGKFLWVRTPEKSNPASVRTLVMGWYREKAEAAFQRSLASQFAKLNGRIKRVPALRVRQMAKRWGSCTNRGEIYLNSELIYAPPSCIDYVVVHELCHLVHPNHGRQFYGLLQRSMPDWQERKARLEAIGPAV